VIVALDEDQARQAIRSLLDDGIRAIAVSLLWSFRNPAHERRLRELIAAAAFLSRWRGTALGLQRFLATATGVQGFEIDERDANGQPRPFYALIRAPKETEPYRVLLERIIELAKPAYVKCELIFKS